MTDLAIVEAAWKKHWCATARCDDDAPTSAHDIERSGFYSGYLAAIAKPPTPKPERASDEAT